MEADPVSMCSSTGVRNHPATSEQEIPDGTDHVRETQSLATQTISISPVIPVLSPDQGFSSTSNVESFPNSAEVSSVPVPRAGLVLRPLNNSVASTPLTTISSVGSFLASSASVAASALTSVSSLSPLPAPSNRLISLPGDFGESQPSPPLSDAFLTELRPSHESFHSTEVSDPSRRIWDSRNLFINTNHTTTQSHAVVWPRPPGDNFGQFPSQTLSQGFNSGIYTCPQSVPQPPCSASALGRELASDGTPTGRYSTQIDLPQIQQRTTQHNPPMSFHTQHSIGSFQNFRPPSDTFGIPPVVPFSLQGAFLGTPIARDALLAHAHHLYRNLANNAPGGSTPVSLWSEQDVGSPVQTYRRQLLPLLQVILNQQPGHLPTLLLLSCVQYSIGDYDACLDTCKDILNIDPTYVEAMSNIGMALRAKGQRDAEMWWIKAVRLRPTYWDAIDNLLHVLCETVRSQDGTVCAPRFQDALQIIDYVLSILIRTDGLLLTFVPPKNLHRLENLLFTSGNLRSITSMNGAAGLHDYRRALELIFRYPGDVESGDPIILRDIVIATFVIGLVASSPPHTKYQDAIANALNIDPSWFSESILERGVDWLPLVHKSSHQLVDLLLEAGKGVLPMVLLVPEKVERLPEALFNTCAGALPGLCVRSPAERPWRPAPGISQSNARKVSSNIFLTLSKLLLHNKDPHQLSILFGHERLVPWSQSLVTIFYYLALSLNPNPSIFNNMGILFFSTKHLATATDVQGRSEAVNGVKLAQIYYRKGLEMDPYHPQLLTNYGSLLKDQGRTLEAISIYEQALKINPNFDIALVNIANAIKDSGRVSESILYYQRALSISPDSPEAVCGLASALGSICDWRWGRGSISNEPIVDDQFHLHYRANDVTPYGWMGKLEAVTKKQLQESYTSGVGVIRYFGTREEWGRIIRNAYGADLNLTQLRRWKRTLDRFYTDFNRTKKSINEAGVAIRIVEMLNRIIQQRWFYDMYGDGSSESPRGEHDPLVMYKRLHLPDAMEPPLVPSVLPFHTFTYALDARTSRLVAHRNALRISFDALTAPWLPATVYKPPPPPEPRMNIGYVSSDFNNHPLSHLMLSVFSMHDRRRYHVFAYATSSSDNSIYRHRIEQDAETFRDVSTSSTQAIVEQITEDQIHILVDLGGYTKAARSDIFAARPSPIQVSLMGYAATSAAGWCDYVIADKHACPREAFEPYRALLRRRTGKKLWRLPDSFRTSEADIDLSDDDCDPESPSNEWSFTERFVHMPHSYFVTDHRQAFPDAHSNLVISPERTWLLEERLRYQLRKEIFPDLDDDIVIFACFSQLYKICPSAFHTWLRILERVSGSVLWLLRFPPAGEEHLLRVATLWAGKEVASRIRFTEVACKEMHIRRCRVADLFLDTFQCNAHTIAADVLWSGTPILTWPKDPLKMCTRVASSLAYATGFGDQMVVLDRDTYEERAVSLASSVSYQWVYGEGETDRRGMGELIEIRKKLFLHRNRMPLFDTKRWTCNLENAYEEVWKRWVNSCREPFTDDDEAGCITLNDNNAFFAD